MLLLKAFLRKGKTRIYVTLLSILFFILILLYGMGIYSQKKLDDTRFAQTSFIMMAKENHDKLLNRQKEVVSYRKALSFGVGKDDGYDSDVVDDIEFDWNKLLYDKDIILAFSSSSCGLSLNDDEVGIFISDNVDYLDDYNNTEIFFRYNDRDLSFKINSINSSGILNYVCISDNLYDSFIENEINNIYEINTTSYSQSEKLSEKWADLEDNNFFRIVVHVKLNDIKDEAQLDILENMVQMFKSINIVATFIFVLVVIFVVKDLIEDEEKDINLLKEIGFNKWQNMITSLKNMLVLDFITFTISYLLSFLATIILNSQFNFDIVIGIDFFVFLGIFVLFVEMLFLSLYIRKY